MKITLNLWDKKAFVFVDGDLPESVVGEIHAATSFDVPNAQYTPAYKRGEWDGRERLFRESSSGDWYFPVGLTPTVVQVLGYNGIDFELSGFDRPGRGEIGFVWDESVTLRDYQQDAVDVALREGMGTVVSPTGTGKTLIGLRLMYTYDAPCMVVCDRTEVADQWADRIEKRLGVAPARFYGDDHETGPVMVALYQSIYQDGEVRDGFPMDHRLLIQDEAHMSAADTYYATAIAHKAPYRFGFTATYNRENGDELKIDAATGPVIVDFDVEDMIESGWLANPEFRILDPPPAIAVSGSWQEELSATCHDNERNKLLVDEAERMICDGVERILMDVRRINHGERLTSMLQSRDIDARFVYSETPDRKEQIHAFEDGEYPVLVSTLVGTGWDCPELEAVILSTPVKSATANIQTVGRALRPSTDKARIVDVADKGEYTSKWFERRFFDFREYYGKYGPDQSNIISGFSQHVVESGTH